jgi:glycosyltransferase involved in cell wall biosynthesis
MARRRICFPFIGDSVGGSHLSTLLLIKGLDESLFEPLIVVHQEGNLTAYLRDEGLPYLRLPIRGPVHGGPSMPELARRFASCLRAIAQFLRSHSVEAVHANDLRCNQSWAAPTRLTGVPLIWHQRTRYAPSRLTLLTMGLAGRLLCNSGYCRSTIPARFRNRAQVVVDPFETLASPLDRAAARRMVLAEAGRSGVEHVVGFCGTLSRQKRPEQFIETAALLKRGLSAPALFVLIGRDRDGRLEELRDLASRLGVLDDLFFAGFRHPAPEWLAALDVLLAPQVDDAFGRTLVEAMLAGTPVIATETGGHREIVRHGETGLLTPPDDAAAAADACLRLLDAATARRFSQAARRSALATFGVEAHVRAVQQVYDSALAA